LLPPLATPTKSVARSRVAKLRSSFFREHPETAFRSWDDGGSSVFGAAGFMAACSVGDWFSVVSVFLIFTFQAAIRGGGFNRTIFL
jgi:hypothetical protein